MQPEHKGSAQSERTVVGNEREGGGGKWAGVPKLSENASFLFRHPLSLCLTLSLFILLSPSLSYSLPLYLTLSLFILLFPSFLLSLPLSYSFSLHSSLFLTLYLSLSPVRLRKEHGNALVSSIAEIVLCAHSIFVHSSDVEIIWLSSRHRKTCWEVEERSHKVSLIPQNWYYNNNNNNNNNCLNDVASCEFSWVVFFRWRRPTPTGFLLVSQICKSFLTLFSSFFISMSH